MAIAGSLTYDTKIDSSGFEKGINKLANTSKSGLKSFTDTIERQEKQLKKLKEEYINVVAEQGKNSKTALELKNKYDNLNKELDENKEKYEKINNELDKNTKNTSKFSALTVAAGNLISSAITKITSSIGEAITDGIKYNATIEQLSTSFEVMTGSADKSAEIVQKLKDIGSKTPFEFTGLAETVQLLMNYGLTADDSIEKMQMLGDISQGSAEKMNRIAMAYGQMSSAGKVSLEDIKQMIDFCHVA